MMAKYTKLSIGSEKGRDGFFPHAVQRQNDAEQPFPTPSNGKTMPSNPCPRRARAK